MPGHKNTKSANLPNASPGPHAPPPPLRPRWCGPVGPLFAAGGTDDQSERFARAEGACPDSPGRSSPAPRW